MAECLAVVGNYVYATKRGASSICKAKIEGGTVRAWSLLKTSLFSIKCLFSDNSRLFVCASDGSNYKLFYFHSGQETSLSQDSFHFVVDIEIAEHLRNKTVSMSMCIDGNNIYMLQYKPGNDAAAALRYDMTWLGKSSLSAILVLGLFLYLCERQFVRGWKWSQTAGRQQLLS